MSYISNMIKRQAEIKLIKLAKNFRSVAVIGPRQSGKTTLCRSVFPRKPYVSLENPDIQEYATTDPRGFLNQYKRGAILDEIQKAPQLFSYLQQILDETKTKGLFILTGSNNFLLQQNISQTLSGRIAYLQLLPLSLEEIRAAGKLKTDYKGHILQGGYPEVVAKKILPADWYAGYISTYVERDLRQLKNINNLSLFVKLLRLCAGRTGQILNLTSLSNDCGIDQKTVASWLSILQSSYVIYLLKPYYNNFNKRIIKAPKLYFYDTGIACSLLGINAAKQLASHAAKGSLFENMMIIELLKKSLDKGLTDTLYYWRDKTGNEVDLLIDLAGNLTAIELKAGETVSTDFFKGLHYFSTLIDGKIKQRLIYGGAQIQKRSDGILVSPWNAGEWD
jgi:uncharacterized protein